MIPKPVKHTWLITLSMICEASHTSCRLARDLSSQLPWTLAMFCALQLGPMPAQFLRVLLIKLKSLQLSMNYAPWFDRTFSSLTRTPNKSFVRCQVWLKENAAFICWDNYFASWLSSTSGTRYFWSIIARWCTQLTILNRRDRQFWQNLISLN